MSVAPFPSLSSPLTPRLSSIYSPPPLFSSFSFLLPSHSVSYHSPSLPFFPQAQRYIRSLPHFPKKNFYEFFVGANPVAVDLLDKLLCLDPDRRPSAVEALEHRYFERLHQPDDEVRGGGRGGGGGGGGGGGREGGGGGGGGWEKWLQKRRKGRLM